MPYVRKTTTVKKTGRTSKGRSYRRKGYSGRRGYRRPRNVIVNPSKSLITPRYFTKLEYSEPLGVVSGLGPAISWTQFKSNSCFDPFAAVGGHQPMGYDQLTSFYEKYRVHAVLVVVKSRTVVTAAGQNPNAALVIQQYKNPTPFVTNLGTAEEDRQTYVQFIDDNKSYTFKRKFYPAQCLGNTRKQYNSDPLTAGQFQNLAGGDPTTLTYLNIGLVESASGVPPPDVQLNVHLTFWVECFAPREIGQS